jgi:hypothetical protein
MRPLPSSWRREFLAIGGLTFGSVLDDDRGGVDDEEDQQQEDHVDHGRHVQLALASAVAWWPLRSFEEGMV